MTGIILLTNDGDLSYKLSHPRFQIEKKYIVHTVNDVDDDKLQKFKTGFDINNQKYKAEIRKIKKCNGYYVWNVILTDGKNREIKKIFKFLEASLLLLHRYSFAGLLLDNLKEGDSRLLSDNETNMLHNIK